MIKYIFSNIYTAGIIAGVVDEVHSGFNSKELSLDIEGLSKSAH
ncbi:MAG: hypothetical protein PHI12_12430 [Dehalococcoidales bacterium]|nr:hypothetical protein [Dehalococcoidales bacterium]